MTELVVDASVAVKWFRREEGGDAAGSVLARHQRGSPSLVAPSLLGLELVNSAARRWRWSAEAVRALAEDIVELRIRVADPTLEEVAVWATRGLTAYDASYVALAEQLECELVTADTEILALAPGIARALVSP